jgi:GTP-binding protein Era
MMSIQILGRAIFFIVGMIGGFGIRKLIIALKKEPRRVSKKYSDKIVVGFFGPASSGKSSAVKALYNIESDSISPIPGTTTKVGVKPLYDTVLVADTPGLQDINDENVKKAKSFIDDADIFVYIVNSNGGITEKVRAEINLFKNIGRPFLLVFNKIDTINSDKLNSFLRQQRKVTDVKRENFIAVAFDPLSSISEQPINIKEVRYWISSTIKQKGNELLKEKKHAQLH